MQDLRSRRSKFTRGGQWMNAIHPYLDDSERPDRLAGGVRMIPITTPKGDVQGVDQARRQQPAHQAAAAARRPGRDARVLRGLRQLPARRRASSTTTTTSSARSTATSRTSRSCGSSPRFVDEVEQVRTGARARPRQLLPARPVVGRHPRDGVRARTTRTPQGPGHLEHDVEQPGLQRVRARRADAGDGPGGAGRDQGSMEAARRLPTTRATWSC